MSAILVLWSLALISATSFITVCFIYRDRGFLSRAPIYTKGDDGKSEKRPIGPPGKLLMGNLADLDAHGGSAVVNWFHLYKTYGPAYELSVPFVRLFVANHPRYMEHMQKTSFNNFGQGTSTKHIFGQFQRDGIFVSDGQAWYTQRKAATRAFTKKNFENHITNVLHRHLDVLVQLLRALARKQTSFDFQNLMSRFMVTAMIQIAFHDSAGMDNIFTPEPSCLDEFCEFTEAFDNAQHLFDARRRNTLWPLTERLSGQYALTEKAVKAIYDYMDNIVEERLNRRKDAAEDLDDDRKGDVDLLDLFLQSSQDKYTLSGMCVNFLLAGRDTTAYGVTWFLLELLRPEHVYLKLVQRAREDITTTGVHEYLDYDESPKLKFMNALWNETMRLDPVAPAQQLEVIVDDVMPAIPEMGIPPIPVKKGDLVVWQNYVLSRMPEFWGPDAESFKPDRWFNKEGQLQQPSPFVFHSWNAGPRTCLGKALATHEAIAIFSAILPLFDFELAEPNKTFEPAAGMNMGIQGGLWVNIKERRE